MSVNNIDIREKQNKENIKNKIGYIKILPIQSVYKMFLYFINKIKTKLPKYFQYKSFYTNINKIA